MVCFKNHLGTPKHSIKSCAWKEIAKDVQKQKEMEWKEADLWWAKGKISKETHDTSLGRRIRRRRGMIDKFLKDNISRHNNSD